MELIAWKSHCTDRKARCLHTLSITCQHAQSINFQGSEAKFTAHEKYNYDSEHSKCPTLTKISRIVIGVLLFSFES